MRYLLLLIGFIIILNSCKTSYVHLFKTESTISKNEEDFYVFENDSVKLMYAFWEAKGVVNFSIFNKLDVPIYLDWRKSSYIDNSVKLNYWEDEQTQVTTGVYNNYVYRGPFMRLGSSIGGGVSYENTSIVKPERITFIPPNSAYYRSQFYILPEKTFRIKTETVKKVVSRNDKPNKETTIYSKDFTRQSTPLIFRNFLTFSTTESFDEEFYIDNEFYISEIKEMDKRHFSYNEKNKSGLSLKDEEGNFIVTYPFKSMSSFYKEIPRSWSIEKRKK